LSGRGHAYMGTTAFAAQVLRVLAASAHPPRLVITPPDRPRGRGRRLASPPVADLARELGLPLHQTESVNRDESRAAIAAHGAEIGTVCAFGQLIREPLLSEVPMLNIHPSLLPRWRGAAPIERALMAGDERTGVCVIRLTEGLDSGPLALCESLAIGPQESFGELAPRLAALGGELLIRALDRLAAGELELTEQPEEGVTYAEKVEPAERRLDPTRPALEAERKVRALTPHIGAHLELAGGERLGVRRARAQAGDELPPGTCRADESGELLVGFTPGVLAVAELQPAGKRVMASGEYLRGNEAPKLAPGG
jgi:methionyl-tRNA formyltransferase